PASGASRQTADPATCEATPQIGTYQVIHVPGLPAGDRSTPPGCASRVPGHAIPPTVLELPEVGGHGLSDTWHGDAAEQAARTAELNLHRVGDPRSLWAGVRGIEEAGREGPELASYLQLAWRAIGGDLQAFFAPTRNRADLLVSGPHAYRPHGDPAGLNEIA